jgi:hypothetical protein
MTALHIPVSIHSLVPRQPTVITAMDASRHDMGGFYITMTTKTLWRQPFPPTIQRQLITTDNPQGLLTNSELKLAAMVVGGTLAAQATSQPHTSVLIASDNVPAQCPGQ